MAGNYPDVPAPRIAYDKDGTDFVFVSDSGSVSNTSLSNAQSMNDESDGSEYAANFGTGWYAFLFPQLRDLRGYFLRGRSIGGTTYVQVSSDTTNGFDGTWTTVGSSHSSGSIDGGTIPDYRTSIYSLNSDNVKAFRVRRPNNQNRAISTIHIYGTISSGESTDRLRLWHPTLDEPLDNPVPADGAYFDWGDTARGTTADRAFRIKNNSVTLTANDVDITMDALTNSSPSMPSQHTFSDGGAFNSSLTIANIAPDSISSVITLRRAVTTTSSLSIWAGRINVTPGSWS